MIFPKQPWPYTLHHTRHNQLKLLATGDEFIPVMEDLFHRATSIILLQMYIIHNDEVGRRIMHALSLASRRGVHVFVLMDSFGCSDLSEAFLNQLKNSNIEVAWFRPLQPWSRNWGWGRRLHRKVLVVDHTYAVVGGINIGNEYTSHAGQPAWLDFAVQVQGTAVEKIYHLCVKTWNKISHLKIIPVGGSTELPAAGTPTGSLVLPMAQNTRTGHWRIYRSYLKAVKNAKNSILIANGYFLPDWRFRIALKRAARRGVQVKLILSKRSDVKLMQWATHAIYSWLLKNGIEIHEWLPANMHAKAAVVDGIWCTVGSFNLDELSLRANIELNLDIVDPIFCKKFEIKLNHIIDTQCEPIISSTWRNRSIWFKPLEWIAYYVMRFIMNLPTLSR